MSSSTDPAQQYTPEHIVVLEGLEHVRSRPGMYIGGMGQAGLHALADLVLAIGMAEALAGTGSEIQVDLLADSGCRVRDDGQGIPVHPVVPGGRSFLEHAFVRMGGFHQPRVSEPS